MLPFLLIQTRDDDAVVADELRSTAELGGFGPGQLAQLQLDRIFAEDPRPATGAPEPGDEADSPLASSEQQAPPALDWPAILQAHSGVILCGSPFNSSDPEESKSALQRRVEAELRRMLDEVVRRDYPFFGACYGVGTLGLHQGAVVDRTFSEEAGPIRVTVTPQGRQDPLLADVEPVFQAFVGHKEAVRTLPPGAVLLAGGEACPVQMFRIGANMYATQFHPELDQRGLLHRLRVYANHGYYDPENAQERFDAVRAAEVTQPQRILANFRRRYARSA